MIHPDIPHMALSIQNPWGWLIANNFKAIENRTRRTHYRGLFAIHAGKNFDGDARADILNGLHPVTGADGLFMRGLPKDFVDMGQGRLNGGIIGVAEVVDCVEHSDDDWFVGPYGYVIRNARPVPFIRCNGMLGFFDWRAKMARDAAEPVAA